jgi:bacillithiol biosynthesis cysteine-adding enzyme BshC
MEPFCVRHTDLPHTTKLFADYVYHFDRVEPFYGLNPADPASYTTASARINFPDQRRAALVAALGKINEPSPALEMLARPGTCAVVTGQQVGLFSGPCYSIYKALTAVKLANALTARGIPSVPVFWLATEDHDDIEVNHCWAFDKDHRPVALRVETGGSHEMPVGEITLDHPPLDQLRSAIAQLPFGEEVAAIAGTSYAKGRTFGSAFRDLLSRTLGRRQILFIDPLEPEIRSIAAPLMQDAVARTPELIAGLLERNRALEAAGFHAQVRVEPASSLFFLLQGDRRIALRRSDQEYKAGDRRVTSAELGGQAEQVSPNALLRPVVQDYVLPTVAYVGGPAEIAYLAQARVLYEHLIGHMPVVVPRSGFTLLDQRAVKLLGRYKLTVQSSFHGLDPLKEQIARTLVPNGLRTNIESVTASVSGKIEELRGELAGFDSSLAAALEKSRGKILYQLSKIDRKVARESLRRDERALGEAEYLSNLVYPHKHLQERFYTILPFLAKHGLDLVDQLYDRVRLDCPDHLVIPV